MPPPSGFHQGRLQRGKWTQLASSLAQGGKEFHPQVKGGKNSPRYMGHIDDCIVSSCHYMRFLGSKFTQNALAAGAPLRTQMTEQKHSPRPLADFRGPLRGRGRKGRERGRRENGEGILGRERGREREGRGREGKGKEEGKGGEGSLRHWR